ncbi:MAG: hypothetical protein WBG32_11130 [Nodosilinea sp.]
MNKITQIVTGLGVVAIASATLLPQATAQLAPPALGQLKVFRGLRSFLGGPAEDRSRGSDGGSRDGGPICVINPGHGEVVWHSQPLLLLQGNIEGVALHPTDGDDPFWSALTPPSEDALFHVQYDGDPLQPGQHYEQWVYQIERDLSVVEGPKIPFQIMPVGAARDRIAAELTHLEAKLQNHGATAEEVATARAEVFFEHDLPADGLQELFLVEAPSADLVEARTAFIQDICSQDLPTIE